MIRMGMKHHIDASYNWTRLSLKDRIARLRAYAKRDRLEVEGLWIMWSHAGTPSQAALFLRSIGELSKAAAGREEQADHLEREYVRRVETMRKAHAHPKSLMISMT
jgi:hypothetical protein